MPSNPEVFPETPLFVDGVTAPRVIQVAINVAAAMRSNCPEITPEPLATHAGPDGGEITHVAWPLYEGKMRIPRLDASTRSITRETIWNTLYLTDNGVLGFCIVRQDGSYQDIDLQEQVLRRCDEEADYKTGKVSALRDLANTRFAAKALTVAAFDLHNYIVARDGRPNDHILKTLMKFASKDNPQPDYTSGGPGGSEDWPRLYDPGEF